jgi:phage-related minor tail protein
MAESVRGINVVIGADTTKLGKALSNVEERSKSIRSELKQVDKLLKFNPGNTEALAQKQKLLSDQIQTTAEKLDTLRSVEKQVQEQFQRGDIGEAQYRAFRREIEFTEISLNSLKNKLSQTEQEQQRIATATKQLETLFKATGKEVNDFANVLGSNLTSAISNGTASSRQLDLAIKKIGQAAFGTKVDLDKMKQALASVDDGNSLKNVRKELDSLAKEANEAKESVGDLGSELTNMAAGLAAGGGIAGAIEKALDVSTLKTKIDVTFEVPESSKAAVKDAVRTIEAYGVDAEAALEGVRRQWALNKNASDEANTAIVKGAATIASSYSGIDFTELIQEVNKISHGLGVTNEEALGLVDSLLQIGFPPEQLDIIAEYGKQLRMAGFDAQEIKNIMSDTDALKSWNIDNMLDGLKEGRIHLAEFGQEVPKAMKDLLSGTDISAKQLQEWGRAVAEGGGSGTKAMSEVAKALAGVKDETQKNALGVAIFGTMWEDQGANILNLLQNAGKDTTTLAQATQNLAEKTKKIDASPAVQLQKAMGDLKTAAEPMLGVIANVVSGIAKWIQDNPTLAATIAAIVSVIGILTGAAMALAPIFTAIAAAAGALGVSIGAIMAPIGIAIVAITALIAAGIALWKNWDSIKAFLSTTWEAIKNAGVSIWNGFKSFLSTTWNAIKTVTTVVWNAIKSALTTVWNVIKNTASTVFNAIKTAISTIFNVIRSVVTSVWNGIKSTLITIWNGLKNTALSVWNGIKSAISNVVNGIRSTISNVFNSIKSTVSSVFNSIRSIASSIWNGIKSTISTAVNTAKSAVSNAFSAMRNAVSSIMSRIKSTISSMWNNAVSYLKGINLYSIGKDIIQGLINGIGSLAGSIKRKVEELASKIPAWAKKMLGIHSPSRVMRDQVGVQVGAGLAQGISKSTSKVTKAAAAQAKAIQKAIGEKIKNLEVKFDTGKISASKYISELKKIQSHYKLTGDLARKIQREIYAASQGFQKSIIKINEGIKKANEKYYNSVKAINDKLKKDIQSVKDEYNQKLKDLTNSIYNQVGLFDEVKTENVDASKLLQNLKNQNAQMKQFQADLAKLQKMGVSKAFIDELRSMGLSAADEIHAIASMPKNMMNEYVKAWKEKHQLANKEANIQLADAKKQMEAQIRALTASAKVELSKLRTEWVNSLKKLNSEVVKLGSFRNSGRILGRDTVKGLINGLKSMSGPLADVAKSLAKTIEQTIKKTLKIKSPSRVMRDEVGKWIPLGLAEGIARHINAVVTAANRMSQAAIPSVNNLVHKEVFASESFRNAGFNEVQKEIIVQQQQAQPTGPIVIQIPLNGRIIAQETFSDIKELIDFHENRRRQFAR